MLKEVQDGVDKLSDQKVSQSGIGQLDVYKYLFL